MPQILYYSIPRTNAEEHGRLLAEISWFTIISEVVPAVVGASFIYERPVISLPNRALWCSGIVSCGFQAVDELSGNILTFAH